MFKIFKDKSILDVIRLKVSNFSSNRDFTYKPKTREELKNTLKCVNVNPSLNWVDFTKNIDKQVNRNYVNNN